MATTNADVRGAFSALQPLFDKPENEDTWQRIDTALKKFHALVRSGLCENSVEFTACLRKKECVAGFVRSLTTERTRLSGTTLEVISSITRLSTAFQPLLAPYLPSILRLLCRTNKLYISRTLTTLRSIIKNTRLAEILKFITLEWKAEGGKSSSFRIAASEIILDSLGGGKGEIVLDRDALDRKYVEEIEWVVRIAATDKEVKVRALVKAIWEIYQRAWPERVTAFSAPLTPVIRKYLSIGIVGAPTTTAATATRTIKKPQVPSILKSSHPSVPRNPLSQSTNIAPAASTTTARPKSNPLSKSVGHSSAPVVPPKEKSRPPVPSTSRSIYAPPLPVPSLPTTHRIAPTIPPPLRAAPPPLHSVHSTPSSSNGAFRPHPSISKAILPLVLPKSSSSGSLAKSTSTGSLSHHAVPTTMAAGKEMVVSGSGGGASKAGRANNLGPGNNLPILRKAGRAIAIPPPPHPISTTGSTTTTTSGGSRGGFKPKLFGGASRAVRPVTVLEEAGVPMGLGAAGPGTIMRAQKTLASAREVMKSHPAAAKGKKVVEVLAESVMEGGEDGGEEWDGNEGPHIDSQASLPLSLSTAAQIPLPLSPPLTTLLPLSTTIPTSVPISTTTTPTKSIPTTNENWLFSPIMSAVKIAATFPLPTSTNLSPTSIPLPVSPPFASSISQNPLPSPPLPTTTTTTTATTAVAPTDIFADLLSLEQESFQTRSVLEISPGNSPSSGVVVGLSSSLRGRRETVEVEVVVERGEEEEKEDKTEEFARFHYAAAALPLPASPLAPSPLLRPTTHPSTSSPRPIKPNAEKEESYNALAEESTLDFLSNSASFDEDQSILFDQRQNQESPLFSQRSTDRLSPLFRDRSKGGVAGAGGVGAGGGMEKGTGVGMGDERRFFDDSFFGAEEGESTFRIDSSNPFLATRHQAGELGADDYEAGDEGMYTGGGFDEDAPTVILSGFEDHLPFLSNSTLSPFAVDGAARVEEEDDVVFRTESLSAEKKRLEKGGNGTGIERGSGGGLREKRINVM